jgi:hypothetical protein
VAQIYSQTAVLAEPSPPAGRPIQRPRRAPAVLLAIRPLLFAAAVATAVLILYVWSALAGLDPRSPRAEYGLHVATIALGALATVAVWWSRRQNRTWDADLLPALFGGLAALTLLTVLHGTPFDIQGLSGDQTFRTAQVTRFADSWHLADYTYRGLPAYYAPAYFWVLGRVAALGGLAPWHMLKLGTIAVAFGAPILSYLLWRRIVPPRVAAIIAITSLIFPTLNEPYAWLIQAVIVPWWLLAIWGLHRPEHRLPRVVTLGVIGAALFMTYYYYFFLLLIMYPLLLLVQWRLGQLDWRQIRRSLTILAISGLGSTVYWGPLAWNFLTAPQFDSLNNRWMTANSGDLTLPMLQFSVTGALCMLGLVYLVWTAREQLSRSLLIILAAAYVWHGLGYLLAAANAPIMAFRMRSIVPVVLFAGAALAGARLAGLAVERLPAVNTRRVLAVIGAVLVIFAGDSFVTSTVADPQVWLAHDETRPSGSLPEFHSATAKARQPSAEQVNGFIAAHYTGIGHPVVLSDRSDLFAFYPYYGFVQFNANYSHPTSRYHDRLAFLDQLARASTPHDFATQASQNPYDPIDVIVLRTNGTALTFTTADDAFPFGTKQRIISIPAGLVQGDDYFTTTIDGYLIAVRR